MLRIRRWRSLRIPLFILLGLGFLYSFHDKLVLTASPRQRKTKWASHATFEHVSPYRQHTNRTFEDLLDAQLITLSETALSYNPTIKASLKIHQIATAATARHFKTWVSQWRTNNPGWGFELLTTRPTSLLSLYSPIPSIETAYEEFPAIQHDLTKYLMLWAYGGFYSDIDTWERVSLKDCAPIVEAHGRDVSLVVGVEKDEPFFDLAELKERGWSRGTGFGTGTLWAPRRFDPILRKAIVRTLSHAHTRQSLNGSASWPASFKAVIGREEKELAEIAGSGMFTDIVLETLSEELKEGHELRDEEAGPEKRVSWKKFRALKWNLWLEPDQTREGSKMRGIAILPINVWNSGQGHSSSGAFEIEDACVNHVFGGKKIKAWYKLLW